MGSCLDRWVKGAKAQVLALSLSYAGKLSRTINKYGVSLNYKETKIIKRAHPLNATRVFICEIYSNLTIKHCDKTKVKTITVKNSKDCKKL